MRSDKTRFLTERGQNLPRCSEFRASRRLLVWGMWCSSFGLKPTSSTMAFAYSGEGRAHFGLGQGEGGVIVLCSVPAAGRAFWPTDRLGAAHDLKSAETRTAPIGLADLDTLV